MFLKPRLDRAELVPTSCIVGQRVATQQIKNIEDRDDDAELPKKSWLETYVWPSEQI